MADPNPLANMSDEEIIAIYIKIYGSREMAELALAIERGEIDGDVIEVTQEELPQEKQNKPQK